MLLMCPNWLSQHGPEVCSSHRSPPILWKARWSHLQFSFTQKDLAFDLTICVRGYDCEDLGTEQVAIDAMDAMDQTPTPECQAQSGTKTTKSTTSGLATLLKKRSPSPFKQKHLEERNWRNSLEHMLPNGKPSSEISHNLSCQLQQTQHWRYKRRACRSLQIFFG